MNVEEAFKKSVEYFKDVLEFLDKVKDKKLRKDKEDLIVALRVFLDKTRSLTVSDSSDNERQKDYDDVEPVSEPTVPVDYDDVLVDQQPGGKSSPSKSAAIIPPLPCELLKDAIIADYLDVKREKSIVKGAWVKRWCVIQGNLFYMYETSKDKKQKDAFELNGFNVIVRDDITKESKRKDRCFELKNIQTNKVYDFCAMEKNSVQLWKQCFEKASLIASSNQGRLSLPKVTTLPSSSPSHGTKLKNFAGMISPLKTMMKKTNDQDNRTASITSPDADDVYVDTEDPQQQLPIYDDTETLPNTVDEDDQTYDDVGDASAPERKLPVTPDVSNRTMPRPPKSNPLPATTSSNQRRLPSEPNKFTLDATPQAPPRPTKDNQTAKQSGLSSLPASGNRGKKASDEAFDQKEDGAKYKDVNTAELYQGMWDCHAADRNELSFKRGQIVHIISKEYENHGWWVGKRDDNVGLVPKEYLMEAYEK